LIGYDAKVKWVSEIRIHAGESGVVEHIERFRVKYHLVALTADDILPHRHVQISLLPLTGGLLARAKILAS